MGISETHSIGDRERGWWLHAGPWAGLFCLLDVVHCILEPDIDFGYSTSSGSSNLKLVWLVVWPGRAVNFSSWLAPLIFISTGTPAVWCPVYWFWEVCSLTGTWGCLSPVALCNHLCIPLLEWVWESGSFLHHTWFKGRSIKTADTHCILHAVSIGRDNEKEKLEDMLHSHLPDY